jgi:two-component system, OmpR family, sensor histidine kinase BaeS
MKISLTCRLFLSILSATSLAILCLFLIMWWSIDRGFYQYLSTLDEGRLVQMAQSLGQAYDEHGNWGFLKESPEPWIGHLLSFPLEDDGAADKAHASPSSRGPLVILDAEKKLLFGSLKQDDEANFKPIMHQNKTVGYVGLLSPKHFLHPMQVRFLSRQRFALVLAAFGMVLLVVIISLPLARRIVKPVKAMVSATHDIASGRYTTRVPVSASDELGQLAQDFNNMALTLEKHEKEQRQWVAAISHELRTPVAVLRGEIEALLDGIRTVTPQTIQSLHSETLRLHRLLEDLYQLALSDVGALTYQKDDIDLAEVLEDSIESCRMEFVRKQIRLSTDIEGKPEIRAFVDRERLRQLFLNVLDNSLKHTDSPGELTIRLTHNDHDAIIEFEDSPPGVPVAELERLFDRLYRAEESRSRASGGAGLGLAICKNIAEGHGGSIAAHCSPLGGLMITITIPMTKRRS